MYSKAQTTAIKQSFWTAFGKYMALQPNSDGLKINWINYKTGIKHLNFKMDADNGSAKIFIEISHPDLGIQDLLFSKFQELELVLSEHLSEQWEWRPNVPDNYNKTISLISKTLNEVSIYKQEDWPALISFFKPRITGLDSFWSVAQYSFESLI